MTMHRYLFILLLLCLPAYPAPLQGKNADEIIWIKERRLTVADFKGSARNKQFEAAANSGIRYDFSGSDKEGSVTLRIEAFFDCNTSYFKSTADQVVTLEHEQGHFDMTEVYARKLVKAFKEQIHNTKELQQKHKRIYKQITDELQRMQNKYDKEIYPDRSKQAGWISRINKELEELEKYEYKVLVIPFN